MGTVRHLEFVQRGQEYIFVGFEPREGKTDLLKFRTMCAVCGEPFDFMSGRAIDYLSRRCKQHQAPGKPTSYKRGSRA